MRRFLTPFLAAGLALAALATTADAGPRGGRGGSCSGGSCGTSSCGPAGCGAAYGMAAAPLTSAAYAWHAVPGRPAEAALYLGRVQVGSYCGVRGAYLPIIGDQWGEPSACPVVVPAGLAAGR